MTVSFESRELGDLQELHLTEQAQTTGKQFSTVVAERLLDLLSTDDAFRSLFERDPRAALQQIGHATPAVDCGIKGVDPVICVSSAKPLASKEQIRAARSELHSQLTSAPFKFALSGLASG